MESERKSRSSISPDFSTKKFASSFKEDVKVCAFLQQLFQVIYFGNQLSVLQQVECSEDSINFSTWFLTTAVSIFAIRRIHQLLAMKQGKHRCENFLSSTI